MDEPRPSVRARRSPHASGAPRWSAWTAWLLRAALAVAAVAAWLMPNWDVFLRASLSAVSLLGLAGAILTAHIRSRDAPMLHRVEAAWSAIFLLHFLGHAFDLYSTLAYDKTLHAAGGVAGALAAYWLARGTTWFWDAGRGRPTRVFWLALTIPVLAGVVVELAEYSADLIFGTGTQEHPALSRLDDTMTDLLAETLTALATASVLAWRARERREKREEAAAGPRSATSSRRRGHA